jgi:lactoylglutathione lyase
VQHMITMVVVSDMKRSVEFYRDTLGLKLRFDSPDWSEFDVDGNTLALHGGGKLSDEKSDPKAAGSASIGFGVEDVDAAYESLTQKDVRFVMPPTTEQQEGIRLAVLLDPDGFSISLVQTVGRAGGKAPDAS